MNVVLLPLNIGMIMHLSTFDVLSIYFRYYTYVHVHGARCLDVWCLAASSSLIGGSGTLQCGIRALVAAWA